MSKESEHQVGYALDESVSGLSSVVNNERLLQEKKELVSRRITLGDQSPWAGGLLRLKVASQTYGNVDYFLQDADAPWIQSNISRDVSLKRGWPNYWSFACRQPFSLETPTTRVDNMRQSLGSPKGLTYLIGPKTTQTIASESNNIKVNQLVKEMLLEEIRWSTKISEWLGNTDGAKKGRLLEEAVLTLNGNLTENLTQLSKWSGLISSPTSFIDSFSKQPPQLVDIVPKSYYWVINNDGKRSELSEGNRLSHNGVVVPKGRALPLEVAARGEVLGFTGLSYLDGVIGLRNKYVPDLTLRLAQIEFNWELDPDPIEAMWEVFNEKKRLRGQEVEKPISDLERIRNYWRGRPTIISHTILGGELNPRITYREV